MAMGVLLEYVDTNSMWVRTVDCIRKITKKVLGISRDNPCRHKGGGGMKRSKKN